MSGENRRGASPPPHAFYTVYPGFHGHVNSGFQDCHPQAPPPKYEDVISGEYLKSNHSNCNSSSPSGTAPAYQSIGPNCHCACPRTNTAQSENSFDEDDKNTKCSAGWNVLIICVLISLFIWRVTLIA